MSSKKAEVVNHIEIDNSRISIFVNGTVIAIKRFKRKDLSDFFNIYERLLKRYMECNFCIGSMISDDAAWSDVEKIASLLPIEGQEELGLDLTLLEEEWDILNELFFTTSFNTETGTYVFDEDNMQPGYLCRLNRLDFLSMAQELSNVITQERYQKVTQNYEPILQQINS